MLIRNKKLMQRLVEEAGGEAEVSLDASAIYDDTLTQTFFEL